VTVSGEGKTAARALERAAASLRKHAPAVGRELAKLERKLLPRGNDLDPVVHEKRSAQSVLAIAELLEHGPRGAAVRTVEDQLRLRQLNGFGPSEFLHLSFVYLTVLRRFVVTDGKTLGEGVAAWDAVEEFLLPKMGEYIRMCLDMDDPTVPSGTPRGISELLDVSKSKPKGKTSSRR
jgi:hypothetical protein